MSDSINDKLKKVRKPRVHITYDVETNGATETKELPFVIGTMGDYSGDNTEGKKSLKERKFVSIDKDNFNQVLQKVEPKLNYRVENTLSDDSSDLPVDLTFKSIEDFEPQNVAKQIEPIQKLIDARNKLRDLMSKADRSEELEELLEEILQNSDKVSQLSQEIGSKSNDEGEK